MLDPKTILDSKEKVWFLGSELLSQKDRLLIELMGWFERYVVLEASGSALFFYGMRDFSNQFLAIMEEAVKRGYGYVVFDKERETQVEKIA